MGCEELLVLTPSVCLAMAFLTVSVVLKQDCKRADLVFSWTPLKSATTAASFMILFNAL